MQLNELTEQVRQGTRLPDMDRAFNDTRTAREARVERRGAAELRRTGPQQPEDMRMPPRFGAGF